MRLMILWMLPALAAAEPWPDGLRTTLLAGEEQAWSQPDQPRLLQFWASWCHSCEGVTADLAGLLERAPRIGHVVISIDEQVAQAQPRSAALLAQAGSGAAIVFDGHRDWARRFEVVTVPTIVLLDAQGLEMLRISGHPNSTDLRRIANALVRVKGTTSGNSP